MKTRPFIKDYSTRLLVKRGRNIRQAIMRHNELLLKENSSLREEQRKQKEKPFRMELAWSYPHNGKVFNLSMNLSQMQRMGRMEPMIYNVNPSAVYGHSGFQNVGKFAREVSEMIKHHAYECICREIVKP